MSLTLLGGLMSCGAFTKTQTVPIPATPCAVPGFHKQAECAGDVICLLDEFGRTLIAEHAVSDALERCAAVKVQAEAK
jgi:hypothetical protein